MKLFTSIAAAAVIGGSFLIPVPAEAATGAHQRELARNGGVDRYKGALIWNDGRGMYTGGLGLKSGWERHVWKENRSRAYANDNCRFPTYQGRGCQTLNGKPIGPNNEFDYMQF